MFDLKSQLRDAAQRAKDRAAREARRVRPAVKAEAVKVAKAADAVDKVMGEALGKEWSVPVSMPRAAKDKK
jgi:hypothetical protein